MNVRAKLGKLEERAKQHYDVLLLPDGTEVYHTGEDAFYALCAVMDQEEHWLLPYLRRAEPIVPLVALVRMLEGSSDGS